jgi:hypothetical protein
VIFGLFLRKLLALSDRLPGIICRVVVDWYVCCGCWIVCIVRFVRKRCLVQVLFHCWYFLHLIGPSVSDTQKCKLTREELKTDGRKLEELCPVCSQLGIDVPVGCHKSEKDPAPLPVAAPAAVPQGMTLIRV